MNNSREGGTPLYSRISREMPSNPIVLALLTMRMSCGNCVMSFNEKCILSNLYSGSKSVLGEGYKSL